MEIESGVAPNKSRSTNEPKGFWNGKTKGIAVGVVAVGAICAAVVVVMGDSLFGDDRTKVPITAKFVDITGSGEGRRLDSLLDNIIPR